MTAAMSAGHADIAPRFKANDWLVIAQATDIDAASRALFALPHPIEFTANIVPVVIWL